MNEKHKKVCTILSYIEHLFILAFSVTEWVSISAFGFLVGIPRGSSSSRVGLKLCAITTGIKKYKSKLTEQRKNMKK